MAKDKVVKPSIEDILNSTPLDKLKLVWYTESQLESSVLYNHRLQKSFNVEICRSCGLRGVHVVYSPDDLVGLKVDINKYVHVELELEDGFAVMSECALHPVTGLWTSYIHSGFAKKIK